MSARLPRGIVPVLQTPFDDEDALDFASLGRLIESALAGGAAGFLAPAVASEVSTLTDAERQELIRFVIQAANGRVPLIAGCSASEAESCSANAAFAESAGAAAILISPPDSLRHRPDDLLSFLRIATASCGLPLILQDLDWTGPGISLESLHRLRDALPQLAGVKVETVPAGPKYTQLRTDFGTDFHISGGWAIAQMVEAMDRGVDAFIPEASMVSVYSAIWRLHHSGRRPEALRLFRDLLPVVSFTNQEIRLSIAFFKRLLLRKGIISSHRMRLPDFEFDAPGRRIAHELIGLVIDLETRISSGNT